MIMKSASGEKMEKLAMQKCGRKEDLNRENIFR